MLADDYDAACELYDALRRAGLGGDVWNSEVALAWEFLGEAARACAADPTFRIGPDGARIIVSARRRNLDV